MPAAFAQENVVLEADCLAALGQFPDASVDAVYLDPPFFTQKRQEQWHRRNKARLAFDDSWGSRAEYLAWLAARLEQLHRVLRPSGAILLHCDWRMGHRIRVLLEERFGEDNFRNEIVWSYRRWTNAQNALQRLHQTILYYAKSDAHHTRPLLQAYSETTNLDQIWQRRARDAQGKSVYARGADGQAQPLGVGKRGVPLGDVWEIPALNPKAKERTGYPTQKPLELLERLLAVVSDEGDLVLDPCCGSGTALVAAKLGGRRWLGIDLSSQAVQLSQQRLDCPAKSVSVVLQKGRAHFARRVNRANAHLAFLLALLDALPVARNRNLDGFLRNPPGPSPVGVRLVGCDEPLAEAARGFVAALEKKKCAAGLLVYEAQGRRAEPAGHLGDAMPLLWVSAAECQAAPEGVLARLRAMLGCPPAADAG